MNLGDALAALAPDGDDGFTVTPPENWRQGRTLYGGLNAALCARAARLAEPDTELGPLRALQLTFLAPSAGSLRFVPRTLRRGRSVTFVGVDCVAGGVLTARATLTYGQPRESTLAHTHLRAPEVPSPERSPDPELSAGAPAFLAHMELRFAGGTPPFSGGDPTFAMWVRHREAADLDPESALLAIADVLPPAAAGAYTAMRPVSSVTWSVDLAPPPPDPGGWYLLCTASDHAAEGYSLQAMSCFAPDGRPLAVGRQTVAVF